MMYIINMPTCNDFFFKYIFFSLFEGKSCLCNSGFHVDAQCGLIRKENTSSTIILLL